MTPRPDFVARPPGRQEARTFVFRASMLAVGLSTVLAVSCSQEPESGPQVDEEPSEVPRLAPVDTIDRAPLMGTGSEADSIVGEVAIVSHGIERPLELRLNAQGLPPGDHAWDIHTGSCASGGTLEIELSETGPQRGEVGPLQVDETGVVNVSVDVPELSGVVPGRGEHSLHIHAPPIMEHRDPATDMQSTIACADL